MQILKRSLRCIWQAKNNYTTMRQKLYKHTKEHTEGE
jgi:hypothetical protein